MKTATKKSKNGTKPIVMKNKANLKAFERFIPYLKAKSKKNPKDNIDGYRRTLSYLEQSTKGKDFGKITDKDILKWITELEEKNLKQETTVKVYCHRIAAFLKWLNDGELPKSIKNIMPKGAAVSSTKKKPITWDDALQMAKAALNLRDRCMAMLFRETGARLNELRVLQLKDITYDKFGAVIEITNEKISGRRKTRIIKAALELKDWLDHHPDKNNQDSYLFCPLNDPTRPIGEDNVIRILRTLAKKSGFGNIHSHLFRHSRATELAELGYSQYDLENLLGWKRGSPMAAVYVHGFDSTKKQLVKAGILKEGEELTDQIEVRFCPWTDCQVANSMAASYCCKCMRPLDETIAKQDLYQSQETLEALKTVQDEKFVEAVLEVKKLLEINPKWFEERKNKPA